MLRFFLGTVGLVFVILVVLLVISLIMQQFNTVRHTGFEREVFGETIHYLDSADNGINPEGTTVLLIHGSSGNLYDMEFRLAPALQAKGFRTISIDRPGLGSSSRNDPFLADPRAQAALFDRFLAQLGVDQSVVLGHSLGNASAMGMAMNYPDRVIAVVNVAGVTHTWLGEPWWMYQMTYIPVIGRIWTDMLLPIVGPLILQGFADTAFAPDPIPEDFIYSTNLGHIMQPRAFAANADDNRDLRKYMVDMFSDYDKITTPFLLMWGENEDSVPYWNHGQRLVGLLPDTKTVIVPGVGHMMQHYGHQEIADELVVFLNARGLGQ